MLFAALSAWCHKRRGDKMLLSWQKQHMRSCYACKVVRQLQQLCVRMTDL